MRSSRPGLAPGSVAQTLAALSKLYAWANKTGIIDCPNPVAGCERTRSAESIDFLARDEVVRLLAHAEQAVLMLDPMIATAIYCGLRKGELFGLRWSDVALEPGRIAVNRSYLGLPKSGKARHLPIPPELKPILRQWRDTCPVTIDGLVFPVEAAPGRFRMGSKEDVLGLPAILTAADCHVPKKPWHALRHTFAAHAVMAGIPLYTVQRLLGHASLAMTQRYAHLAPDHFAAEAMRLSFASPTPGASPISARNGYGRAGVLSRIWK